MELNSIIKSRFKICCILIVLFSGCKQTPECEDEFCPDQYFFLYEDASLVLTGDHIFQPAWYSNGLELVERAYSPISEGIATTNPRNCESLCGNSISDYYDYVEYKRHFCSHELNGIYPNQYLRTDVSISAKNITDSIQNISFFSFEHNGSLNPDEVEVNVQSVSFPINELENYFVGDTIMNSYDYEGIYIIPLEGVDLFYSHEYGMLNTYFDPDFVLVP